MRSVCMALRWDDGYMILHLVELWNWSGSHHWRKWWSGNGGFRKHSVDWEHMIPQHHKCFTFWSLLFTFSVRLTTPLNCSARWHQEPLIEVKGARFRSMLQHGQLANQLCILQVQDVCHWVLNASDLWHEWSSWMIVTIDIINYWSFQSLVNRNWAGFHKQILHAISCCSPCVG